MSQRRFHFTFFTAISILAAGMILSSLSGERNDVSAHAPRSMELTYDIYSSTLTVTITHETASLHYVENILVQKNDIEYINQDYTGQDGNPATYEYDIPAVDGDILSVTATCNVYGTLTEELTVLGPKDIMDVSVNPTINTIIEGETEEFIVNIYSEETPLDGVEVQVTSQNGEISDVEELGIGAYQFTYTAGPVEGDTEDVMNITCTKNGFYPAYTPEMEFTILDDTTPENQIILSISPSKTTVDEGSDTAYTVTTSTVDGPLDGTKVTVEVDIGDILDLADSGGGEFTFTFRAPTVSSAGTAMITINAMKTDYLDGSKEIRLSIRDLGLEPTLDGVVSQGEYSTTTEYDGGNFVLHYRISGDNIMIAMVGKTSGYVGIGFDPGARMEGADMIIGWVDGAGNPEIFDAYSEGPTGPHPSDEDRGGTNDILSFGGTQSGGITIIEFVRKMATGDSRDKDIPSDGDIDIIWALGESDSFSGEHGVKTGYGTMNEERVVIRLWPIHAMALSTGFILMGASVLILYTLKDKKWWFKAHKITSIAGGVISIIGLIIGIIMVQNGGGPHLAHPHSYLGIVTILMIVLSPIMGLLHPKVVKKTQILRPVHLWLSRVTLVFMLINIVIGLIIADIF